MGLYYLPVLIRSDRYFIAKLDDDAVAGNREEVDFNFVAPADDRVISPLITIEDPAKVVLTQMAPSGKQDIPLRECSISLAEHTDGVEILIKKAGAFSAAESVVTASGLRLDYSAMQKKVSLNYYHQRTVPASFYVYITLQLSDEECYSARFHFAVVPSQQCQRVVIDFGSEASQIGYKNSGPQAAVVPYDILENIISRLTVSDAGKAWKRDEFLNHEAGGQQTLYRSFYAVKKNMTLAERENFPFNFCDDLGRDEVRLFITRAEVGAREIAFRDNYEIIPNLKLGIEKSIQLRVGNETEDYSIRSNKKQLISAILLRMLRLMLNTKPAFRQGGIIVTLLVPNIYTQDDVFDLLSELRRRTPAMLSSLHIPADRLHVEYETISESDAAFMGYQQTHPSELKLGNGDIALVIDCGKGTTDISMVIADDNENYSSFFRTGFAGAGNVLSYAFAEDFLTMVLRAIPGTNDIIIKDFIAKEIQAQNLTVNVLNFLQWIEELKKRYRDIPATSIGAFAELTEQTEGSERTVANLHKDPNNLLSYAESILYHRNIRWDEEVTGIIDKATNCIVHCIISSIHDVITRDIRKRIKVVMLSGRAFYFDDLKVKLEEELKAILGTQVKVHTVPPGRLLNNKNVAIHGAFSGAYKITDFTGIPVDKKEGLSRNNDVLNNNIFLYKGIKVQPGNDILYNTSVVRRNNQQLKTFKNKTVDIFFTRDNIYLRLMENQQVKDVRSLYTVLTTMAEVYSPIQDMRAISMFPGYTGELASINTIYGDVEKEQLLKAYKPVRSKSGIFSYFSFNF